MRKRKLDPKIIRVGDKVKILCARPVLRVGYPKVPADYLPEAEAQIGEAVTKLLAPYRRRGKDGRMDWLRKKILGDIAYVLAGRDGLGGTERQLFFGEMRPELKGLIGEVTHVRIAKTGKYFSPTSYSCPYSGEHDYDCGGLTEEQTHKLLTVKFDTTPPWRIRQYLPGDIYSKTTVFLAEDVEKIQEEQANA